VLLAFPLETANEVAGGDRCWRTNAGVPHEWARPRHGHRHARGYPAGI